MFHASRCMSNPDKRKKRRRPHVTYQHTIQTPIYKYNTTPVYPTNSHERGSNPQLFSPAWATPSGAKRWEQGGLAHASEGRGPSSHPRKGNSIRFFDYQTTTQTGHIYTTSIAKRHHIATYIQHTRTCIIELPGLRVRIPFYILQRQL